MRKYQYISADSHLEVPPTLWRPFVEERYREYVPKVVQLPTGGDAWQMPNGDVMAVGLNVAAGQARGEHWENVKFTGISYVDSPPGTGDGEQRIREMDVDGVDAEILFPAVSGNRGIDAKVTPPEAQVAIVRGYNNWLSEAFCAVDYERLLGVGLLPVTGVDDAIAELERVADLPGIRTVVLHQWPNGGPKPEPEIDMKFWRAAVETGVPLSIHIKMGGGKEADTPPKDAPKGNWAPINALITRVDASGATYVASQFISSRVFDRFPSLVVAFAETGVSWVPFYAESADSNYMRHRWQAKMELDHEPSYYINRNFLWGIQDDYAGIRWRHEVGVDKILWATDFPHAACDWPLSMKLVDRLFDGVPEEEKHAMCAGNAARFYKLDKSA